MHCQGEAAVESGGGDGAEVEVAEEYGMELLWEEHPGCVGVEDVSVGYGHAVDDIIVPADPPVAC